MHKQNIITELKQECIECIYTVLRLKSLLENTFKSYILQNNQVELLQSHFTKEF